MCLNQTALLCETLDGIRETAGDYTGGLTSIRDQLHSGRPMAARTAACSAMSHKEAGAKGCRVFPWPGYPRQLTLSWARHKNPAELRLQFEGADTRCYGTRTPCVGGFGDVLTKAAPAFLKRAH